MARANLMGLTGLIVSFCCFTVIVLFTALKAGFGSPSISKVDVDIYGLTIVAATLYIVGTLVALFHQVGGVLQMPSIAVFSFLAWYNNPIILGIFGMVLPILGTSMIILSWFLGAQMPGFKVFVLHGSLDIKKERILTKKAKAALAAVAIASLICLVTFFGLVFTQPVSTLEIEVLIDGATYGPVNLTITVDERVVAEMYLEPSSDPYPAMYFRVSLDVSGGTHRVLVDVTSDKYMETNGVVDERRFVRVLPFTEQYEMFGIGVGFA